MLNVHLEKHLRQCRCKTSFVPNTLPRRTTRRAPRCAEAVWGRNGSYFGAPSTRSLGTITRAAETESKTEKSEGSKYDGETYEVYIQKPLGIRFGRGRDGGAYVTRVDETVGNIDERIEVGDKIVQVSASFGEDVWEAGKFGQCMYAIKTRNGDLYFRFQKMNGDLSIFEEAEESETEAMFKRERAGGNYGGGTKELQLINFKKRQEREAKRKGLFETGLSKFNKKDIQGALYDFEEVIAMERRQPQTPREFAKVTSLFRVSHYNVACCYAAIEQVDPGLEALDTCLKAGFDQFSKIRSDPNLEQLRQSPKFKDVLEQYDEPVIDTNIFNGLKGLFGGKK